MEMTWERSFDFGVGFDRLRGQPMERGVKGKVEPPPGAEGVQGQSIFKRTDTVEEFDKTLGIGIDAGGGFGLFEASAKFDFRQTCKVSTQATFCIVKVTARNPDQNLREPVFTEDAWKMLEARNTKRFRERFGDMYVRARVDGIEFFGVTRIEAQRKQVQEQMAAQIEASYGLFEAKAKIDFNESMKSESHKIEVLVFQNGGRIQFCNSLEAMFDHVKEALEDTQGAKRLGRPLLADLADYKLLKHPHDDTSYVKIDAAERALRKLAEHARALEKIQNDVDFVLRNPSWFALNKAKREQLNNINAHLAKELKTIADKADVCSKDFDRCEPYAPKYPDYEPPERIDGPSKRPRAKPAAAIDHSIGGVLLAGRWRSSEEIEAMQPDDLRNTLIVELTKHTINDVAYWQGRDDEYLMGAGAVAILLRDQKILPLARLAATTDDEQRNTLIVHINAKDGTPVPHMHGKSSFELARMALALTKN